MPQNPLAAFVAQNPSKVLVPIQVNAVGELITTPGNLGIESKLDITTTTVIAAVPATLNKINVVVGGSTPGTIYDAAGTAAIAGSLELAVLGTTTLGFIDADWPCLNGIVIVPGTSQVIGVAFTTL
jgi:hypothetical protein